LGEVNMIKRFKAYPCFFTDDLSMEMVSLELGESDISPLDTSSIIESTDGDKLGEGDSPFKEVKTQEIVSSVKEEVEEKEQPSSLEPKKVEKAESSSPKPTVYSTTIKALKEDGILPDLEDDFVNTVDSPEKFIEAIDKQVEAKLDAQQKRIKEALDAGVETSEIQQYEGTVRYLEGITTEILEDEGEDGQELRKTLIYQDLILKGFKEDRARKAVEKSVADATDIDDAKEAYEALKEKYTTKYTSIIEESKKTQQAFKAKQDEFNNSLNKKVLETEVPFEGVTIDKKTRQKVLDNITKATHKGADGQMLTELQKYAVENPADMSYYLGLFYTLTDGFKKLDRIVGSKVVAEKNKHVKQLEQLVETNKNSIGASEFSGEDSQSFSFEDLDVS